jgi:hypothetical protein
MARHKGLCKALKWAFSMLLINAKRGSQAMLASAPAGPLDLRPGRAGGFLPFVVYVQRVCHWAAILSADQGRAARGAASG